jgi:Sec-independent protein translocase protein TatA
MSAGEIIMILFVYLLLFGAKGVPALGKAVYQFRNAARDVQDEIMSSANEIRKQANVKLDQLDLGLEEEHNTNTTAYIPPQAIPRGNAQEAPQEESTEDTKVQGDNTSDDQKA